MIKTNTVLVLGAGASIPFGFPSGQKLKDNICGFRNDGEDRDILKYRFVEGQIDSFIQKLMRSGVDSVDQFLEYQPSLLGIGKQCIALALLRHERTARLFDDWVELRSGGYTDLQSKDGKNWYQYLFSRLDTAFDEFGDNKLSVITFNYDRSLEHYLFTCLQHKFAKSPEECAAQLNKIPIIHVHGKLGRLRWEHENMSVVPYDVNEDMRRKFQDIPDLDESAKREYEIRKLSCLVGQAAEHIKIIHDDVADAFGGAHDLLRNTTRIYFLGFGFNKTNMLRLFPKVVGKRGKMSGTCLEVSPHVRRELTEIGMLTIAHDQHFIPTTIYDFLYNYPEAILD